MNNQLTDITVVIDRSGSMEVCREDAEGGFNAFIRKQAAEPGQGLLTIVQFDTVYEFVFQGVPLKDVRPYKLEPRGGTALYDAIGRAVIETGQRLDEMAEADRPGLVIFAIITDGEENSSREFSQLEVLRMIKHQTDKYNWQFVYLGANQDAFKEAQKIGIPAANSLAYRTKKSTKAMESLSTNVSRARNASYRCREAPTVSFTDEERKASV